MEGGENDYMTALNKKVHRGFTLVELLIVIALLAIIALIVIAAINPIEQRNRARDTGMRADGAQLVSAIDRFFTARSEFPWVTATDQTPGALINDSTFGFVSAGDFRVGLCGGDATADDCDADGLLITTDELKPEFGDRNFIDAHVAGEITDQLMVGKEFGSSESVYICYVPLSKSNRDTACDNDEVYTLDGVGIKTPFVETPPGSMCDAESTLWSATPLYVCIPE